MLWNWDINYEGGLLCPVIGERLLFIANSGHMCTLAIFGEGLFYSIKPLATRVTRLEPILDSTSYEPLFWFKSRMGSSLVTLVDSPTHVNPHYVFLHVTYRHWRYPQVMKTKYHYPHLVIKGVRFLKNSEKVRYVRLLQGIKFRLAPKFVKFEIFFFSWLPSINHCCVYCTSK